LILAFGFTFVYLLLKFESNSFFFYYFGLFS